MRTIVAPISALVLRTIGARFGAHPTTYFVYQLFPETTRASGLSAKSVNLDNRVFSLSALMKWAFQLKADRASRVRIRMRTTVAMAEAIDVVLLCIDTNCESTDLATMIAFFIDADNFSHPEWVQEAVGKLESRFGSISVRRAYGSLEKLKGLSDVLRTCTIRSFANLSLAKNTTDIALAVDVMEMACQSPRPSVIAIASRDADFGPLAVRLRERGIVMVCVSQQSKNATQVHAVYDEVILVGANMAVTVSSGTKARGSALLSATTSIPSAPIKPPLTATNTTTAKLPTPVRKKVTNTPIASRRSAPIEATVAVQAILAALPKLRDGTFCALHQVASPLRSARLLGANALSVKFFKAHPRDFELEPSDKPTRVRYCAPIG